MALVYDTTCQYTDKQYINHLFRNFEDTFLEEFVKKTKTVTGLAKLSYVKMWIG